MGKFKRILLVLIFLVNLLIITTFAVDNSKDSINENIVENKIVLNDNTQIEENNNTIDRENDDEKNIIAENTINDSNKNNEIKDNSNIITNTAQNNITTNNNLEKDTKDEVTSEKNENEKLVENKSSENDTQNITNKNSVNEVVSENKIEQPDNTKPENTTTNIKNTKLENNTTTTNNTIPENTSSKVTQTKEKTNNNLEEIVVETKTVTNPSLKYQVHVQNIGWQGWKKDSETAGTSGLSYRLEGIKLNVNDLPGVSIKYQVHVQNIGWQGWKSNGQFAGTEGQSLRLEAIKIRLESSDDYSIMYRTHVQNIGWQDWKSDGELSGTEGLGLRLEAIQIKIVKKIKKSLIAIENPKAGTKIYNKSNVTVSGYKMSNLKNTNIKAFVDDVQIDNSKITYQKRNEVINIINGYGTSVENPTPGFKFTISTSDLKSGTHKIRVGVYDSDNNLLKQTTTNFVVDNDIHVLYQSHVQNIGWQGYKMDGALSGTEGMAYRVEALKIKLYNAPNNGKIKYRTHIQNIGWQDWKSNDQLSGTEGKSLRIEALQIKLENMPDFTVEYQVHIQNKGWSDWFIDGETAGTVGESLRIEAIRIRIVSKYKRRYLGIDVSRYNGTVDWKAVKNSGIDFVMIRVGFRGYGQEGNFAEDPKFRYNIEGAKAAGIKVGIYFFTQAITEQEAIEEAEWTYNKIKDYKIDYPVAIDVEFSSESNFNGRADHLDRNTRTQITKRFCEKIQSYGYTPMVYLNVDWATNYVNMSELSQFDTWIAHYKNNPNLAPSYNGNYTMWQYTASGHVNGINGDVDCNICYKRY